MNTKNDSRQSNFELLRIFAMLLIIGSHLASHGVQYCLSKTEAYEVFFRGSLGNKLFVCFLNPGGDIGVALFFMITGYFLINKEGRSITKILLEGLFYGFFCVLLYGLTYITGGIASLETKDAISFVLKALVFPVSGSGWWFVTAYVIVTLVSPLINIFLHKLSKKGYIYIILVYWVLWYSLASVAEVPFYSIQRSLFFYFLGAYIRLHFNGDDKRKVKIGYFMGALVVWAIGMLIYYGIAICTYDLDASINVKIVNKILCVLRTSCITPICAICIFKFFELCDFGTKKIINFISRTTFGIYLIHDSLIGRNFIWYELVKIDELYIKKSAFPLWAILVIICVFIICSLIDCFRLIVVEPVMMNCLFKIKRKVSSSLFSAENDNQ